jgi:hypothetical protein
MNEHDGGLADDLKWQPCLQMALCPKGWPQFPEVPEGPGIYRLTFADGSVYVGESANLRRRLYEYPRPTKGNEGERRIHLKLREPGPRAPTVEVFNEGDTTNKAARCRLEQVTMQAARDANMCLVNEYGQSKITRLKSRIAFLENELSDARRDLSLAEAEECRRVSSPES